MNPISSAQSRESGLTVDQPQALEPAYGSGLQQRSSAWLTPGRFALVLGLLVLAMFPEVILGERTFFYRDFSIFGYSLAHYHRECFWRGEWPLWNPLNNLGLPFLAQWNTLTLYPFSLFYLIFPLSWSLGVFCLGHLFLAGFGMYHLARRWSGDDLAGAVAGVGFAFNGLTWHALMWPNNISALGWMPLVVLMVERAWQEGGRRVLLAALVSAVQLLAGAPEILLLTWSLLGLLWCAQTWRNRREGWQNFARCGIRFGLVFAVMIGLSAAQLLPFVDLLKHSQRDAGYGDLAWSMPSWGLANFLVPLFRTQKSYHGVFSQFDQYWTCSYFAGIGVVALALFAAWRVRDYRVGLSVGAAVLALVLALGEHGYLLVGLRGLLPQLGFMRFPIKFVVLAVFLLPLLAAFAVAWLRRLPESQRAAEWRRALRLGLTVVAMVLGILLWSRLFPMAKEDWSATWRNALGRAGFLGAILMACGASLSMAGRKRQILAGLVLLVLLWLDILTHAPTLNPTVERSLYAPGLTLQQAELNPAPVHGRSRVLVSHAAWMEMRHTAVVTPHDDLVGRRVGYYGNLNLLDGVSKVNGFYSLYMKEADDVIWSIYGSTNKPPPRLLDFLNVGYVTAEGSLLDYEARPSALPLVTLGQKPVFVSTGAALGALCHPRFAPTRVVYLPAEAAGKVPGTNRTSGRVVESRYSAHEINLQVTADEASMLVVAQTYYPAWKAYVDNHPTPIWRANSAFQAISVPAGEHKVRFAYEDRAFRIGLGISGLTLLAVALAWFRLSRGIEAPIAS